MMERSEKALAFYKDLIPLIEKHGMDAGEVLFVVLGVAYILSDEVFGVSLSTVVSSEIFTKQREFQHE